MAWFSVGPPPRFRRSGRGFYDPYNPFYSCYYWTLYRRRVDVLLHYVYEVVVSGLPVTHLEKLLPQCRQSGSGPPDTDRRKEGKGTCSTG